VSNRSSLVGLEEVEITATEKLLAVVLTAFFLIGGVWAYSKLDDLGRSSYRPPETYLTATERAAVERSRQASERSGRAEAAVAQSREQLELSREAYRTALDAGRTAPALARAYRQAERRFEASEAAAERARAEAAAARPAADSAYRRAADEALVASRQSELLTFLLRLALVLVSIGFGSWLLVRLRRSGSRYLAVAFAAVGFAALLSLVLAGDYVTDHIDVRQLGPFVLSIAGIALTLGAFWWLQRFLARRLPQRRVRKGDCPFCGYPVRGGEHCEGCGRAVVGECTTCHQPRRVGTFHCGACGAG
jgi:hypothetical protein